GASEKWMEADKPFAFLAACIEWCDAIDSPGHIPRLPLQFDATCSGPQHLSAMTRDEVGAPLVNLDTGDIKERPNDIYQVIAEKEATAVEGHPYFAELFNDPDFAGFKIDRKLVKGPVMTYRYSGTDRGMVPQML